MNVGDAIVDSCCARIGHDLGLPGVQMYGLFEAFARQTHRCG